MEAEKYFIQSGQLDSLVRGLIMSNPVLEAMRNRRSATRFDTAPVEEEKIQAILEAGRWAPSWLNRQPWKFIVIRDRLLKERISEFAPTVYKLALNEAPVCIAVCVNPVEDPFHYVEDGSIATQNMALAAQSLGLGSLWIGMFNVRNERNSAEEKTKAVLEIPENYRLISILPVGVVKLAPEKTRKDLSEIVMSEKFGQK